MRNLFRTYRRFVCCFATLVVTNSCGANTGNSERSNASGANAPAVVQTTDERAGRNDASQNVAHQNDQSDARTTNESEATSGSRDDKQSASGGRCQPQNVPRTPGMSAQFSMDETIARPSDAATMNEYLRDTVGDFEVVAEYDPAFETGDFNADDCEDAAVVVRHTDAYHNVNSLTDAAGNTSVAVTLGNLRTNALLTPVANQNRPAGLPADMKPRLPVALVIFFGAPEGKFWRHGGAGRAYLLLDAVYPPFQVNGLRNDFVIAPFESLGEEPRAAELPQEARGDGIIISQRTRVGREQIANRKRFIIYFDGKIFRRKPLRDLPPV